jgi:hypothetical protein
MNVERQISDAMVSRISSRTYITMNSIPVRRWKDRATKDGNISAIVHAEPIARLQPNANHYTCILQLAALNNQEADVEGDSLDSLYADLLDELMNDLTAANLTTAIGDAKLTIDGIVHGQGEYDGGDAYKIQGCQANLFLTYTP